MQRPVDLAERFLALCLVLGLLILGGGCYASRDELSEQARVRKAAVRDLVRKTDSRAESLQRLLLANGIAELPPGVILTASSTTFDVGEVSMRAESPGVYCFVLSEARLTHVTGRIGYVFLFLYTGDLVGWSRDDSVFIDRGFVDLNGDGVLEKVVSYAPDTAVDLSGGHDTMLEVFALEERKWRSIFRVAYREIGVGAGSALHAGAFFRDTNQNGFPEIALIELRTMTSTDGRLHPVVVATFEWDPRQKAIAGPVGSPREMWQVLHTR